MAWGPNTPEDTTRFLDAVFAAATEDPRRGHDRAVTRAANGRLIGNCVLHVHDPAQDTAFIGYVLDRAVWGQGFGIEVAVGLLGLGFEVLGLRRIAACG
jgi:[ribosomal protein S5]-alanine N-acetyltransferase